MPPLPPNTARPFFGWHVVAATFVLATFGWGVGFYGPPVFLYAVVARSSWPVALVSMAVTVHFLVGAVVVQLPLPRGGRRRHADTPGGRCRQVAHIDTIEIAPGRQHIQASATRRATRPGGNKTPA